MIIQYASNIESEFVHNIITGANLPNTYVRKPRRAIPSVSCSTAFSGNTDIGNFKFGNVKVGNMEIGNIENRNIKIGSSRMEMFIIIIGRTH